MAPAVTVPFHLPDFGPAEEAAVLACLRDGQIGGDGPQGQRCEAHLRERLGVPCALLTPSATAALELGLAAAGIGPGDEVVLPSFTFPSTANAVLRCGARPVFADISANTLVLDPQDLARVVTPATAAILPVCYGGVGCDIAELRAVAAAHAPGRSVLIVEDAAQGLGALRDGLPLGAAADLAAISFHVSKNLGCGEGGVLLLHDESTAHLAEILREKGTNRAAFLRGEVPHYEWVAEGSSHVLSDLLAALLFAQLARLDEITAQRRRLVAIYDEGLADLVAEGLLRRQTVPPGCSDNGHVYALRTLDGDRQRSLRGHLAARGIEAPFHFVPLHGTAFARERLGPQRALPVTDDTWATLLRLPLHGRLDPTRQQLVIESVREWAGRT